MASLKKEHNDRSHEKPSKDFYCAECSKNFTKSSSFYNHRKMIHHYKPSKDNERGRPVKSESRPFERVLSEILCSHRKAMQDKYFPELAKMLLKIVRKDKDYYDKIFDGLEKFDKDFEKFVIRSNILNERWVGVDFLQNDPQNDDLKRFFRILLENWRLTLKLTDAFCKELAIIIGYFITGVNEKVEKAEVIQEIKESNSLAIICEQGLNNVCEEEFLDIFLEILSNWKKNYNL